MFHFFSAYRRPCSPGILPPQALHAVGHTWRTVVVSQQNVAQVMGPPWSSVLASHSRPVLPVDLSTHWAASQTPHCPCRCGENQCWQQASSDRIKTEMCDHPSYCRNCLAGTGAGLTAREDHLPGMKKTMLSVDHQIKRTSPQKMWSPEHYRQPQQLTCPSCPAQQNLSGASRLTPAEELVHAISKLNTRLEKSKERDVDRGYVSVDRIGPIRVVPPVLDSDISSHMGTPALRRLRQGLIGHSLEVQTPFGIKTVLYADWAASGRLLWQVECFMIQSVYPLYANVHTEAGASATATSHRFEEARATVARCVGAPLDEYAVVFTGSGMTGAAFKLAHLLGISRTSSGSRRTAREQQSRPIRPVVMYSIMEHHSNCLLWRELDCETVVIGEDSKGLIDMRQLELELRKHANAPLIVGSFTAGSNVTGIAPDVHSIANLLHRHGAIAAFDYASAGSSKQVTCVPTSSEHEIMDGSLDAVMLSPHKLVGGPGSCGVLIVRRSIVRTEEPQSPGGGTVAYVNGEQHWYEQDIERREEAGTPDVLGSIRCALAMQLHSSLTPPLTHSLGAAHTMRALKAWSAEARIDIVGSDRTAFWDEKRRLPLVSFNVVVPLRLNRRVLSPEVSSLKRRRKALLHPQFVAAILSDLFGIQARAGCACAGPYGHVLLQRQLMSQCGCSKKDMQAVDRHAAAGDSWAKPGWVRVYFSFLMTETEVDYIIRAVQEVAVHGHKLLPLYAMDTSTGTFKHRLSSGSTVAASIGDAVKGWLGREQIAPRGPLDPTTHQDVLEDNLSWSLPSPRLDEQKLHMQLQRQLHAGMQTLRHPPAEPLDHPAHSAHPHQPGPDVLASRARWFVLSAETSIIVEAGEAQVDAAGHGIVTHSTDGSTLGDGIVQRQTTGPPTETLYRSGCQHACQLCGTPAAVSGLRSDIFGNGGRRQRHQLHAGGSMEDRCPQETRQVRAGRARTNCRPGSARVEDAQTQRSKIHSVREDRKARPSSAKATSAASWESSTTSRPGRRVDGKAGGTQRGASNGRSIHAGVSRATGRLAAAVVQSPAKVKSMNDSDRARAAIAAGKAALAASMRRRQLRSCPPR